jgi:hypothetical protein
MVGYLEDGVSKNVRNVGKTNIRSVNTQKQYQTAVKALNNLQYLPLGFRVRRSGYNLGSQG